MNNECNAVHISAAGSTYRCTLYSGHSGHHKRMNASRTYTFYHWPQITPLPEHIQPFNIPFRSYAKGGWEGPSARGYGKTALIDEAKKLQEYMDGLIAEETPVLLTVEELTAIAYYMPPYTDDKDDVDNIVKDKVYAALKKML